ncbi:uroporphyrinogen-III C-methyltransferase [Pedobacter sp. MC2016-14]|nr:uroporphyrinogen-III C-methyltransferase [Pedobacter sp. MC2016-14]MCD0489140.1 uroporphyrinogen-III C-methyltransferase [Pedobacter sp. MC2016-14]
MERKIEECRLFIMGAGPGDPELITMKAYNLLKRAEVILYDNLSNEELLNLAPKTCKKIYVGKKPYGCCTPQDKINELIVEYASRYNTVVRLKGGDPFIFGRGFEELLFAEAHGINAQYIPGISSMQGAGMVDIPLTHRGISESLWIITGTKRDGSLSKDLKFAMKSSATVVIYMGMRKMAEISGVYIAEGLGSIPAAIIQHVSLPHQKQVVCEVGDLQKAALRAGLSNPAVIVIGDVVRAREICSQYNNKQLAG